MPTVPVVDVAAIRQAKSKETGKRWPPTKEQTILYLYSLSFFLVSNSNGLQPRRRWTLKSPPCKMCRASIYFDTGSKCLKLGIEFKGADSYLTSSLEGFFSVLPSQSPHRQTIDEWTRSNVRSTGVGYESFFRVIVASDRS